MTNLPLKIVECLNASRDSGILIWLFNIGAERYWHQSPAAVVDRSEDALVGRMEEMNLLLCRTQDIMIMREYPDREFLDRLRSTGFAVPEIVVPDPSDPYTPISELVLRDAKLLARIAEIARANDDVYLIPYAVTHLEEQIASRCSLRVVGGPSSISKIVNNKIHSRELALSLNMPVCEGEICASIEEVRQAYRRLKSGSPGFEKVIIKEPHGASGKGLYIVDNDGMLEPLLLRLARASRKLSDPQWLVEGWHASKADINYQLFIAESGEVDVFSVKRQLLTGTVYIGSKMPADLTPEESERYRAYGRQIGKELHDLGYTGIASIDSIITAEGETIVPIVEINGRFTLSTYISFAGEALGGTALLSRYFKLVTGASLSYGELCERLDREGLLFKRDMGEGVLPYTSGTLPARFDQAKGGYPGRLFVLIAAKEWSRTLAYNERLERFVHALSQSANKEAKQWKLV
ncbi:peptide ligase PGM1-related protein [Paenibacillaceae bacterium WGS1546]|uniref:preATP grasp domain-containing protein n=1 Tax=Cohnella sp. WGS1546 TaxID=3366810 RepID=UPI00372CFBDE